MQAYRCPKTTLRKKRAKNSANLVRLMNVVGGRHGLSLCTSSWMTGERGPLFVSVGCKSLSNEFICRMNAILVCFQHFFVPSCLLKYWTISNAGLILQVCCLPLSNRLLTFQRAVDTIDGATPMSVFFVSMPDFQYADLHYSNA